MYHFSQIRTSRDPVFYLLFLYGTKFCSVVSIHNMFNSSLHFFLFMNMTFQIRKLLIHPLINELIKSQAKIVSSQFVDLSLTF